MKKAIPPPENWQDFETLCKKLFGEMWGCSNTIKKNGRSGQTQCGVDICGVPKGENDYWGVQCKGKDNYTNAKLTENELTEEIQKALKFQPKLNTFIFATTAVKDAKIEEYVRVKDIESRTNGGFQISLYCWEDIVDLIEENRDTYNWYVNEIQYRNKFDIDIRVSVNELNPKFKKSKVEYIYQPIKISDFSVLMPSFLNLYFPFHSGKTNHSWCSFEVYIINSGNRVLEDWKLWLEFSNDVATIDGETQKIMGTRLYNKDTTTTWIYEEDKSILYKPINNAPLIQKDSKSFKCLCLPETKSKEIKLHWQLLARDFDREGDIILKVNPEFVIENCTKTTSDTETVGIKEEIDWYIDENETDN